MHWLSKCVALGTQPLTWVLLLLLWACWDAGRHPARTRRIITAAVVLLLAIGWRPLVNPLLAALENKYPEWSLDATLPADVAGVVVLGGASPQGFLVQTHPQSQLNDAAERMTAAAQLVRNYPQRRLLFTGGEGALFGHGASEAQRAKAVFATLGLEPSALLLEEASRNTYENALFSARLPGVDVRRPWVLVTSAWHMPRAVAAFEAQGWNVIPYPVDHRSAQNIPWTEYSLQDGVRLWQLCLHEYVGLAAYRLLGRS